MTALPDPTDFVSSVVSTQGTPVFVRPNLTDHYWGYEVTKTEQVIDLAVLARGAATLLTISAFVAAVLVWLVPAMAFTGDAIVAKAMATTMLNCFGVVMLRFAARGTRVRVQFDTSNGELREVVDGMFETVVLARHGFDSVVAVDMVASRIDPSFGQLQVSLKRGGPIPVGDGAVMALRPLRDKIAADCGLDTSATRRAAIWNGPLTA